MQPARPGTGSSTRQAASKPSPPTHTLSRQNFPEWVLDLRRLRISDLVIVLVTLRDVGNDLYCAICVYREAAHTRIANTVVLQKSLHLLFHPCRNIDEE